MAVSQRAEPLPVPRECTRASLTGDDLATTPDPWGHAPPAGAEHGLVKPPSGMQGKGPELAQCLLSSAADQLGGFRAPRHCPSCPFCRVLEEGPWSVYDDSHSWCDPLLSSPLPFHSSCSEWVSLSSRELDLGVKTQRQGGSQKDCSWPCAGLGQSAPWGLLCLPGMDM